MPHAERIGAAPNDIAIAATGLQDDPDMEAAIDGPEADEVTAGAALPRRQARCGVSEFHAFQT